MSSAGIPLKSDDLSYEQAEAILQQLAGAALFETPNVSSLPTTYVEAPSPAHLPPVVPTVARRSWSEKTLAGLVDSVPDALVVFDQEGTVVLVNHQTEKLFGYRRDELLGQKVELLLPEHVRQQHAEHWSPFFTRSVERQVASLELEGRRKNGRQFPIDIGFSKLETEQGPLLTSTIRDISSRKRLEARYRNLVEGIPAVTFLAALDEGDSELYVSPQIEQLLGFSQKQWLEDPVLWYSRLHPEDRDRWHIEFAQTCSQAAPFRSVYRFIARDGRVVWVQGEAKVVRDAAGRPLFLQGVAFDITERKMAEEALRRSHDELDQLVHERTAELARTNSDLQMTLKEKESLLKEIHHRVKNNLQIISSLLNLQSATIKEAATLAVIRESQNRVRSMGLIHEMLYQSRDLARIFFGQYVRELAASLFRSYGIGSSQVRLRVEISEDSALSIDTAIPCGLILTELVSNCLKHAFSDQQPGEITISLQSGDDGNWRLGVSDNGVGLPDNFDPRKTESLGLKLVISLADQLQAQLDIESANGTSFTLHFRELPPR